MIFLIIVLALIALIFIAVFVIFKGMFGRAKPSAEPLSPEQGPPYGPYIGQLIEGNAWIEGQEKSEHYITASDGVRLCGTYIHNPAAGKRIMLLAHGYRAQRMKDFMASAPYLYSLGFSLFFIDQRAHGKSGGRYITMSAKERRDCAEWIDYLIDTFGKDARVALYGVSMGAATVLAACSEGLPDNVKCVIADCGYTSAYEIYKLAAKSVFHLPPFPAVNILRLYCRLFAGFDPAADRVDEALKNSKIPALFLHGRADELVPYAMSELNFAACAAPKRIEIFDNAGHAQSFFADGERYRKLVAEHIGAYL